MIDRFKAHSVHGIIKASVAVSALLITACSDQHTAGQSTLGQVIAAVDGEPVYAAELQVVEQRFLGKLQHNLVDETIKEKMLDTLLRSKAMAMTIEDELSDKQRRMLDAQVSVFRDDLLVRLYMDKYADKAEIDSDQIKQFYQNNPQLFGGGSKKTVETLQVVEVESGAQQAQLLSQLDAIKATQNWQAESNALREQGFDLQYSKKQLNPALLHAPLKNVLANLTPEDGAQLITNSGLFLIRVLAVHTVPGKPLAEVSAEIQRILSRKAYRQAVEQLSDQVMQSVQIVKQSSE